GGRPRVGPGRLARQVDAALAIGRQRPALAGAAPGRGQAPQAGVLAQPAEDHQPQAQRRLEERPLGVGAVGHQPQRVAGVAQPAGQPAGQFRGQLRLGAELPGVRLDQPGNVLGADVQQGAQRQGQGVPQRVAGQPRHDDPDVAVDELLAGRAGAGVVVDTGALHARAVAGGGGVVEREQQGGAGGQRQQRRQGAAQQAEGEVLGAAAGGPEGAVGAAEVGGDAGGAEPRGNGASATGEEGAAKQAEQARGGAAFEGGGDGGEPGGQQGGQLREGHGRLLG